MRNTRTAAAAVIAVATLTLSACGGGEDDARPAAVTSATAQKAGTVIDPPFGKPDLVLTDTKGEKYDLTKQTKGHPTLLYFGYTHCPDTCPLTMSNIDIAMRQLSKSEQEKLRVVFVSSDPKRDTPKRLGEWLAAQNKSFIGLTGDFDTIQAGARSVGIHLDTPRLENGSWVSSHGTQVLAFSPKDDKAHVLYGKDTTVEDYAKDLPKILKGQTP
jgi:protein SCO1/2